MEPHCLRYVTGSIRVCAFMLIGSLASVLSASVLCLVFQRYWYLLRSPPWVDTCPPLPLFSVALLRIPVYSCHSHTHGGVKGQGAFFREYLRMKWLAVGHVISHSHAFLRSLQTVCPEAAPASWPQECHSPWLPVVRPSPATGHPLLTSPIYVIFLVSVF